MPYSVPRSWGASMRMRLGILFATLALVAGLGLESPAWADVRQIGAQSTDATDQNAVGARTTLTEPGAIQDYDSATYYLWIGAYLADGSFYQAGYARHRDGCTSNRWFVAGFDPSGN